jgi:hypothetical protein
MSTSSRSNSSRRSKHNKFAKTSGRRTYHDTMTPLLPLQHINIAHPTTHTSPESMLLVHSDKPLLPPPRKKDSTGGCSVYWLIAGVALAIVAAIVLIVLWLLKITPFSSSSSTSSLVFSSSASPPFQFSSSSSSSSFMGQYLYLNYLIYGGSGANAGSSIDQSGGYRAVGVSNNLYSQCLAGATPVVFGVTLGDGGNPLIDLNAYRFSSQQLTTPQIAQLCTELCCATLGCVNAAFSTVPVQYPNSSLFGCTDMNSTAVGGVVYDTCCVLRQGIAVGYHNPMDLNYSSVFYTSSSYTCAQGAGLAMSLIAFSGVPSAAYAMQSSLTNSNLPKQSGLNQCLGFSTRQLSTILRPGTTRTAHTLGSA